MGVQLKVNTWFDKTTAWLENLAKPDLAVDSFDRIGQMGVEALRQATPKETGMTSESWDYRVTRTSGGVKIEWFNTNEVDGESIAIMLQYGHGTGTGGYVQGVDYINPSMDPVFDAALKIIKEEVTL